MQSLGRFNLLGDPSLFAVFQWCHPFVFFEEPAEVGLVVDTNGRGDLTCGKLRLGQKYFCFQQERFVDPFCWRPGCDRFYGFVEMIGGDMQ